MHYNWNIAIFISAGLFCTSAGAARLLELKNQPIDILKSISVSSKTRGVAAITTTQETGRFTDFNQTLHVRLQEYYRGFEVWNANAVVHISKAEQRARSMHDLITFELGKKTMNGKFYQNLEMDLDSIPSSFFTDEQAKRAEQFTINNYKAKQANFHQMRVTAPVSRLLIFVDNNHVAHWAYEVYFKTNEPSLGLPSKPIYIIDAETFKIYQHWDDIKTLLPDETVSGGGLGGNLKSAIAYDGVALPTFKVSRDSTGMCYMQNNEIKVLSLKSGSVMQYHCPQSDSKHNNVFWSADFDSVNGGYSPANDAMFGGETVKRLYKEWFGVPALVNKDGTEMILKMSVHMSKIDNAFWSDSEMIFGDGIEWYPMTSLGITAHEVSHGFTEQHSNLVYNEQSGGMNEAFSDMAAQVAEYYIYGKSSGQIGGEIIKIDNESMRYMDQPSKDCYGKEPGTDCSIDNIDQYYAGLGVHYSSGIYNRVFYALSTSPGWNPRKAFQVILQANASYWTPNSNFVDGAACVVKAAQDFGYDVSAVMQAFNLVGIDKMQSCVSA